MEEPALARGTALAPRFIGRRAELEVLTDRLHRLAGGFGGIVVVEGAPGVGTSRLIQEALRQAGRDVRVLHSAGAVTGLPGPWSRNSTSARDTRPHPSPESWRVSRVRYPSRSC